MNFPLLQLQNVNVTTSISNHYLLTDISFDLFKGDRLVIVGTSGAGKTTLLRLLNRLISPTTGSILLANKSLTEIPVLALRRQIVLVPQEPKLLGMSVRETLVYPLVLQQLPKGEINNRLDTWITKLNLSEDWLDRNELQLSLGQRQLIAIARALMMQPQILLLDEPTSALDTGTSSRLIQVLTELTTTEEMSIIMVNHHLEIAQNFAQRVLYLSQGRMLIDKCAQEINWQELKTKLVEAEKEKNVFDQF